MKIHVEHLSDERVIVTLTPSRLGRLFGAKQKRGVAVRNIHAQWEWKPTRQRVASAIEREIECTTVEDLPRAEARRG